MQPATSPPPITSANLSFFHSGYGMALEEPSRAPAQPMLGFSELLPSTFHSVTNLGVRYPKDAYIEALVGTFGDVCHVITLIVL